MFEKLAHDIYNATIIKLANLNEYIEKVASKWARTNAKLFGNKFTAGDYINQYNKAYGGIAPSKSTTMQTMSINPNQVKTINKQMSDVDFINKIKSKMVGKSPKQQAALQKYIDNKKIMATGSAPVKAKLNTRGLSGANINEGDAAQKVFDYVDNVYTPDRIKTFKNIGQKARDAREVFLREGGSNPIMKGVKPGGSAAGNSGTTYKSTIRTDKAPEQDSTLNAMMYSQGNLPKNSRQQMINIWNKTDPIYDYYGSPNDPRVSFFSGNATAPFDYTPNNNIVIGNLNKIAPKIKRMGIPFLAPARDNFSLPNRTLLQKNFVAETGQTPGAYFKTNMSGNYYNDVRNSRIWRKSEIAVPKELVQEMNPGEYHIYKTDGRNGKFVAPGSLLDSRSPGYGGESYFDLKNWIRNSRDLNNAKVIPVADYNTGINNFGGYQNFNTIYNNLANLGVNSGLNMFKPIR